MLWCTPRLPWFRCLYTDIRQDTFIETAMSRGVLVRWQVWIESFRELICQLLQPNCTYSIQCKYTRQAKVYQFVRGHVARCLWARHELILFFHSIILFPYSNQIPLLFSKLYLIILTLFSWLDNIIQSKLSTLLGTLTLAVQ